MRSSLRGAAETNLTSTHEDADLIPGSGVAMSCGAGRRCSLDPELRWLWYGLAATALIQPLAWELPYAMGESLKRFKKKWSSVMAQ